MSVGSIIGGVVGGIIGFVVSGFNPVGAYYGAALGFGLGMMIDPMMPDMSGLGMPKPGEAVMSSEVGTPLADLAGTAEITGHLIFYGGERNEPVYTETSGGKGGGGSEQQVSGYKYYMSWGLGICSGEVDNLYAIYKNQDANPVWPNVDEDGFVAADWEGISLPISGGQETITIDGVGSVEFYFGTDDQAANATVGTIISDSTLNTPYRNMCWAFFDDCYIGEYNRTPTYKFVVKKMPSNAFNASHEIQTYNVNPAHAMWYILSNLSGLPESWLHSADFSTLADTLFTESRGICLLFNKQQTVLNYLETINNHVDNILRFDSDGKFHPKLIRKDYTVGTLPTIDETVMIGEPSFNRRSFVDTINEVRVQYSELMRPEP